MPRSGKEETAWERVRALLAETCFADMQNVQQNPLLHGEGSVYAHTQAVCGALTGLPAFQALPQTLRAELFLAALLHDIGKVKTTRMENGSWVSPHHASAGSQLARVFLWQSCGLCGTPEAMTFRETVCTLIRHHMVPFHLSDQADAERRIREIAAYGRLAPHFSWHLLCMLAEADIRGRIAEDIPEMLTQVQLTGLLAEECGCSGGAYPFADSFTEHAYFSGRNVLPDQTLYDDTWGEVVMLAGLPGTGKDTWIAAHYAGLPMISLDEIRRRRQILPTENQGAVIQEAHETAREFLRKRQPFVWNATDLTKDIRQRQLRLFEQYGARTRIVYLEADRQTQQKRNAGRACAVPEDAVGRMLEKTVLPSPDEAHIVEWHAV